ncbi:hypothetical protein QRW90_16580 [Clostridioides difficile]|uniref:hypothetical protein n=1 Tax=Clostridioides difficile TaxID=1496 RepID=UPI001266E30B|nr:hypothetical protein [Clostridioides difficile]MDL5120598.1 hypothetical protein [Clostridioides difficile]QFS33396.1 hypothetical protein FTB24_19350 [Clostridioides difficile]QIF80165.1 hypothetical protein EUU24_16970 [Clostridioides difficile]
MKKDFKVKALTKNVEELEVNGQGCWNDCKYFEEWHGLSSSKIKTCYVNYKPSAYKSIWN